MDLYLFDIQTFMCKVLLNIITLLNVCWIGRFLSLCQLNLITYIYIYISVTLKYVVDVNFKRSILPLCLRTNIFFLDLFTYKSLCLL